MIHVLSYTSHTHLAPGRHRNEGACSCGATFVAHGDSDIKGRGNVRDKWLRHMRDVGERP